MPTYTYRCANCDYLFDHTQGFADKNLVKCPRCGHNSLQRVYKPVGVVFKGSGFYATDNRSASRIQNGSRSSTEEAKDSSTDKETKKETGSEEKKTGSSDPKTNGGSKPAKD